jgi:hypothetical protein
MLSGIGHLVAGIEIVDVFVGQAFQSASLDHFQ